MLLKRGHKAHPPPYAARNKGGTGRTWPRQASLLCTRSPRQTEDDQRKQHPASPTGKTRVAAFFVLGMFLVRAGHSPSVREVYDGALSLEAEVNTFRHIDQLFPSATVQAGTHPLPLPTSTTQLRDVNIGWAGKTLHLDDYIRLNRVAGLLV